MAHDLAQLAKERGIRYFMISYTDLFGSQRAKLVPAAAIADMQKDGAGFAGFATWLDMTPAHPDLFGMPDAASVIQLPWKKDVAWVAADCVMEDKHVAQAPRVVLKKLMAEAAELGLYVKTGVECEFFLISPDGSEISDDKDNAAKPCYDQQALMRRYDVIAEICDSMLELGWGPYQNDHEDANGQFEMNWNFDDALVTADRHSSSSWRARSRRSTACARHSCRSLSLASLATAAMPTFRYGTRTARRICSTTGPMKWACRNRVITSSAA